MKKLQRNETKSDDELVIFAIKQHPWYFFKFIKVALLSTIIVLASFLVFGASAVTSYLIFAAIIVCSIVIFYELYKWSRTQYLLTNQRVISFEQESLFKKTMKEAMLENILFISNEITGAMNNVLKRGSLHIRASGVVEDEIVFHNVADPYEVQKKITDAQKKYVGSAAQSVTEEAELDEELGGEITEKLGKKRNLDIFSKKREE